MLAPHRDVGQAGSRDRRPSSFGGCSRPTRSAQHLIPGRAPFRHRNAYGTSELHEIRSARYRRAAALDPEEDFVARADGKRLTHCSGNRDLAFRTYACTNVHVRLLAGGEQYSKDTAATARPYRGCPRRPSTAWPLAGRTGRRGRRVALLLIARCRGRYYL